jgi:hypothetical protein
MPKIIFNYKICDKATECGGISECPVGAISYDLTSQKPVWDESKCTFCLKCTLPDTCPVGAIMFAGDDKQEKIIMDTINSDKRSEEWLWQERYGVQPAKTPSAQILTPKNFNSVTKSIVPAIIDVWHEDFLDCRLHSPLYSDLLRDISDPQIYKLDAKKYADLAKKLTISIYPSLLYFTDGKLTFVNKGAISLDQISKINEIFKNLQVKST